MTIRFRAGDKIRVIDKDGFEVCRGTAMQTREFFGWAVFQVLVERSMENWAYEFSLNEYRVEVI